MCSVASHGSVGGAVIEAISSIIPLDAVVLVASTAVQQKNYCRSYANPDNDVFGLRIHVLLRFLIAEQQSVTKEFMSESKVGPLTVEAHRVYPKGLSVHIE